MAIEQREGVLDSISEKGIVLSGDRLSYSKWFEGDRPTENLLGCKIQVVVDAGNKCSFLKRILSVGEKAQGWKPPEPGKKGSFGGGGGRRYSPEEMELEREKGVRIARSVALARAIIMVESGIAVEKIASTAAALEEYLLKGTLPRAPHASDSAASPAIPSSESARPSEPRGECAPRPTARPKKLASQAVNALFNQALRGGLVDDWADFLAVFEDVLKIKGKSPYSLDIPSFLKVEAVIRAKLGQESAA